MRLHLSNPPRIERTDGLVLRLAAKDAALLAWLVVEGPTNRTRLGALLWPDSTEAQALATLRQRLFKLKKVLGRDVAEGSPALRLAEGLVHDDEGGIDLLGDVSLADTTELDAWLRGQRERRRSRESESLRERVQALEEAGDCDAALPFARTLLKLEPLSELAHQRVMRLHYLQGDRAAALAAFDHCEQVLKHELGASPSASTLALLSTIEQSHAPKAAPPSRTLPVSVLRPPRMVGRERERAALQQAWSGAKVAAVIGEAGMGKSRLLAEFIETHAGVVKAAGRPGDAGVPFATLARLLRAVSEHAPVEVVAPEARRQLARVLPELGDTAPSLVEGQRLQLRRAIANYLRSAADLTGLAIDDLHFADPASLEMLTSLMVEDTDGAWHWLLAWRPADSESALHALHAALTESAQLAAIELAPLDTAALAELVDQLDLGLSGAAIAAQLRQRTGGNPLFVLETLKQALVEHNLAELAEDGAGLPRPPSVERLIDRRIGQLSPAALALARVASIAAVDFTIGLAEAVLGANAMQFADAINELEAAQVLKGTQFAHDLVFDAVLRSVPRTIAQHTHGKVADWLERHAVEPARIAAHWLAAEEPARAIPALKQAAEAARKSLRTQEAADFLLRAADAEESVQRTTEAFETVAAVFDLNLWSVVPEPMLLADRLDRLAHTSRERAVAARMRANLLHFDWKMTDAVPYFEAALACARECGDIQLVVATENDFAANLSSMGRTVEALSLFERIDAALETNRQLRAPKDFHTDYGIALDQQGRAREAQARLATALAGQLAGTFEHGYVLQQLAVNRQTAGDLSAARAHATEALRLYSGSDVSGPVCVPPMTTIASGERHAGAWQRALDMAERAKEAAGENRPYARASELNLVEAWIDLGQVGRAAAALREITVEGGAIRTHAAAALCETARIRRWTGAPAVDWYERALALLGTDHGPVYRARIVLERAYTFDPADAIETIGAVMSEAQRLGLDGTVMMAWLVRASVLIEHDVPAAVHAAREALALAASFSNRGVYRLEPWLCAVKALRAHGDTENAREVLRAAVQWMRERVRCGDVAPEFVDGFLHRNPVNRQLLDLASSMLPPHA